MSQKIGDRSGVMKIEADWRRMKNRFSGVRLHPLFLLEKVLRSGAFLLEFQFVNFYNNFSRLVDWF